MPPSASYSPAKAEVLEGGYAAPLLLFCDVNSSITDPRKGAVIKRLTQLWRELADESAGWCGTSAVRDFKTVTDRVEAEGESFLTITLPRFCKAFERGLEDGKIDYDLFSGFKRRGGLPEFLRGFLSQVFDTNGTLLDEPSIDCIRAVRELTLVFGKIKRMCSDARVASAMRQYVEIEVELAGMDTSSLAELLPRFQKASTLLWADVFARAENSVTDKHGLWKDWITSSSEATPVYQSEKLLDPMDSILGLPQKRILDGRQKRPVEFLVGRHVFGRGVPRSEVVDKVRMISGPVSDPFLLVPRHGPGATADGYRGNAKFSLREWPRRLERMFPYGDYALPQLADYNQLDCVQLLEPGAEVAVKLTPVPKTDKTPRVIAEEPAAVQYMQQSLSHQIIDGLEDGFEFPPAIAGKDSSLGRFFVGFSDQEPNRFMARDGSLDGSLATLDLSEASDRVLNEHVELLFARFPQLSAAIQATRSTKARVPGFGVIPLAKFSSMGSALCFPVEAMVFTTIVLVAIAYERRVTIDRAFLYSMRGKVRVYGDDIVVPVEYVPRVIQFLELFGLKVNKDKSFWNGKFRESCGGDFYDGEWVTPVRLRHELPRSLADVDEVVGLVSFRNLLYWNGYWKTAARLDNHLSNLFGGRWKIVESTTAGLGRESVLPYQAEWIDPKLHTPRVSGMCVQAPIPRSPTTGEGALLKFLIKRSLIPTQDKNHLLRQGRPTSARIKRRGIRPY